MTFGLVSLAALYGYISKPCPVATPCRLRSTASRPPSASLAERRSGKCISAGGQPLGRHRCSKNGNSDVECSLFLQKQTFAHAIGMSA